MDAAAGLPETGAAVSLLARLVGFDTTSAKSNRALLDFVRAELAAHGITCRLLPDPTGRKACLHAVIGPPVAGGVALSAHVDCVPVDGQAWRADPFTLRLEAGRAIGRGTTDMKGFLACVLAMLPRFAAAGLQRPIHLCLTHDEETTFEGAARLTDMLAATTPLPAMCIVGEPTGMQPVIGHKGYASWDGWATGVTGHSSQTQATANALEAAATAVAWLAAEARRLAREGVRDEAYAPPYSTVHCGSFHAGTMLNIVPDRADFTFELRYLPGDSPASLLAGLAAHLAPTIAALQAIDPACGVFWQPRAGCPPLALPEGHALVGLAKRLAGRNGVAHVAYGTEAGFFAAIGIPTLVCGPGDIAQAHQPEEWIAEAELGACLRFLGRLADQLAA